MIDNHLKLECLRLACRADLSNEEVVARAEAFANFLNSNQPVNQVSNRSLIQREYDDWASRRSNGLDLNSVL